jgi:uncharacterized protein
MEEILASIRRIIEDSDQVEKVQAAEQPAARAPSRSEDMFSGKPWEAAAERSGEDSPVSSATRDRESASGERRSTQAPQLAVLSPQSAADRADARTSFEISDSSVFDSLEAEMEGIPPFAPANEDWAPSKDMPGPSSAGSVAVATQRPDPGSIISEQAGRQVAAAFEELSEAFAASRRKSFDELAAEMLRPMLQDWLDNNLPTLVERMVREEIERVARGGRAR